MNENSIVKQASVKQISRRKSVPDTDIHFFGTDEEKQNSDKQRKYKKPNKPPKSMETILKRLKDEAEQSAIIAAKNLLIEEENQRLVSSV